MPAAKGLVTVWLHVPPEREEEFNAWYNLEHIAQVVNIPGFTAARRYAADGQVPKYLAWYEAVDEHVEPGPGFTQIVQHPTPWSLRIRRFYGENRFRNNYRMVSSFGTVPTPDAAWLYTVQADCADPAHAIPQGCSHVEPVHHDHDAGYAAEHHPAGAAHRTLLSLDHATAAILRGWAR